MNTFHFVHKVTASGKDGYTSESAIISKSLQAFHGVSDLNKKQASLPSFKAVTDSTLLKMLISEFDILLLFISQCVLLLFEFTLIQAY